MNGDFGFEYNWGDVFYPSFYPAPDELTLGRFVVELSITCYPYMNGSRFDARAFPDALCGLGLDGSTKFAFLARDDDGRLLEGLSWDDACDMADALNEAYHEILYKAANSLCWDDCLYELALADMIYSK